MEEDDDDDMEWEEAEDDDAGDDGDDDDDDEEPTSEELEAALAAMREGGGEGLADEEDMGAEIVVQLEDPEQGKAGSVWVSPCQGGRPCAGGPLKLSW